jgi:hypothetical protein
MGRLFVLQACGELPAGHRPPEKVSLADLATMALQIQLRKSNGMSR